MQSPHAAFPGRIAVVYLRDGASPSGAPQVSGAKKPGKITPPIAYRLTFDAFESRQRQVGDCEPIHAKAS
jgi:hypothetical protein